MLPSHQQQACYDAAKFTSDSMTIDSVAGSGKTTTLAEMSHHLSGSGLSTSFSRPTVLELGKRMSSSFPARTMHGAGKDALTSLWGSCKVDSRNNKTYGFVKSTIDEMEESWQLIQPILSLIDQAQTAGIVPEHDRFLLEDIYENWESLAETYDIQFSELIHSVARRALIHSNKIAFADHIISFNDMIYLPIFFPMRVQQHKTIIVDERQDLSPIQFALLAKQLRKGGRIIAAGDPWQAIYGFRGAMTDSYSAFAAKFGAKQYKLTVSYRCPQMVVQEAQQYVPEIESAPSAPMGDVIHHDSLELSKIPPVILCRNNAPLITLALRLFVSGRSVEVAGKDIGAGLKALTKRIASSKKSDYMKSDEFLARANKWADREISRKPHNKHTTKDKLAALSALAAHHTTLGDIRKHIERLYIDPKNANRRPTEFHLTTIHKAKGREWPNILFLDPQLLPAKWAEQEWEIQQEVNLSYVGVTRSQDKLHYCASPNIHE